MVFFLEWMVKKDGIIVCIGNTPPLRCANIIKRTDGYSDRCVGIYFFKKIFCACWAMVFKKQAQKIPYWSAVTLGKHLARLGQKFLGGKKWGFRKGKPRTWHGGYAALG